MINSTSKSDPTVPARTLTKAPVAPRAAAPSPDQFSSSQAERLRAALALHPEIRPEVVARGLKLAADPAYPSPEVLRQVANTILRAPDPTEE
jgi:hypothetical protein